MFKQILSHPAELYNIVLNDWKSKTPQQFLGDFKAVFFNSVSHKPNSSTTFASELPTDSSNGLCS